MLRLIIIAVLIYGAYYVTSGLIGNYKQAEKKSASSQSAPEQASRPVASGAELQGMPPQLQPSLDAVQSQGPAAMKRWLDANRKHLRDPKLGDIELDYAVALMRQNSGQARATYRAVKERTPGNSPLQPRLQRLSKTFE